MGREGSLFNITGQWLELKDMLCECTDDAELEQVIKDSLEGVQGELEAKAANYIYVIQQIEMEADRAEQLEYEWGLKKKIRRSNVARLKQALKDVMTVTDQPELRAGDYTLKIVKNGGKAPLIIDKPDAVPDNMTKVIIEPDKDRIRQYLDEGNSCEWAHIAERGTHLSIK
jgi:hypothetical protein